MIEVVEDRAHFERAAPRFDPNAIAGDDGSKRAAGVALFPIAAFGVAERNPGALGVLERGQRRDIVGEALRDLAIPLVQIPVPDLLLAHVAGDDGEGVGSGSVGAGIGDDADTFSHLLELGLADHALKTSRDRLALVRRRLELGLSRGARTRGGAGP